METKTIKPSTFDSTALKKEIQEAKSVNLIIDLQNLSVSDADLIKLYQFYTEKQPNGTTFVIVKKEINLDNLPETLNIVPTLQEAKDLISLEEMMRDLE